MKLKMSRSGAELGQESGWLPPLSSRVPATSEHPLTHKKEKSGLEGVGKTIGPSVRLGFSFDSPLSAGGPRTIYLPSLEKGSCLENDVFQL